MKNILLLIFVSTLLLNDYHVCARELKANVASINITPPLEMNFTLGGYGDRMNNPAEGIHDPIKAKALVIKQEDRKFAIITLDILGLPTNVKSDLIKRVANYGWNMENIMLLPSHSHGSLEMAALNSKNVLNIPQIGIFQPELLSFLLEKLENLIIDADRNYRPVKIGTKSQLVEGLNRNRRNDPEVDRELTVTRIDLLDGNPLAVLVNWTAHPTFLGEKEMLVSAEWPGYLQSGLEELIGKGATVMYYNGAEGDQSPILNEPIPPYEKIRIYGRRIALNTFELFKSIKPQKKVSFISNYRTIPLPGHEAHPAFMKTGGKEYGLTEETAKFVMSALSPSEVGIGCVKVGDLLLVGVPGEMTANLGLNVKNSLKSKKMHYVTIGGLANEWISYILTREQYIKGEGYESSVSFYGPDLGKIMSDEVIKTAIPLTKLKK
ncbi:MAG: neutral/alkaline non-lysosomal ceramidase N-terminal domain-containing protein [Mariniphaga sp.]